MCTFISQCIEIRQAQPSKTFTPPVEVVVHEPEAHEEASKGKPMEERGLLAHAEWFGENAIGRSKKKNFLV